MTSCADSTMLRIHLDHPDRAFEQHLDGCATCTGLLNVVAEDAGYVRGRLALLDTDEAAGEAVDVDAAYKAVAALEPDTAVLASSERTAGRARLHDLRRFALAAAAAIAVLSIAVTPPGRAAIADALDAFRGERFQAVPVDLDSWAEAPVYEGLRALEQVGVVELDGLNEPTEVADLAEAEALAGITPPDVARHPDRVVAMAPGTIRIELARRVSNDVPVGLDGAAIVVDVPGAIVTIFGPTDDRPPELVIGRSGLVSIRAEGASLDDVRSFLLSRPELPDDLRAQLASIDDWRSTIPVPVPLDGPGWDDVTIAGRPAVAFGDDSGFAALVLRSDPDGITVVGGRLTVTQAIELAAEA